ncbi:MAG: hypothetical protein HYT70_03500 [Candidatus Aenigmarchaeota archaeon]|nr:hypothetical protein [Candidatus Aenigmarchaeota archaeon]
MAKKSQFIYSSILFLFLVQIASAQVSIPHQLYGNVDFLNGPAPDGLLVEAKIDNSVVASTTTLNGRYGYMPKVFFVTDPNSDRAGQTISLFIQGIDTNKTAIFENGEHTQINISLNTNIGKIQAEPNETITDTPVTITPATPALVIVGNDMNITISSTGTTSATIETVDKLESNFFTGAFAIPGGLLLLNAYEIKISGDVAITVTMAYSDFGVDESTIKPYKFDGISWVALPDSSIISRDTTANTVTFTILPETPYALFGSPPPSGGGGAPGAGSGVGSTGGSTGPVITSESRSLSVTIVGNGTMRAGSSNSLVVRVSNTGNSLETSVGISLTGVPNEWVAMTPLATNIQSGSSQDYLATITIPAGEQGTRTLLFTATSLENTVGSRSVTIEISPPSSITVCGNGICEAGETADSCPADCEIGPVPTTPFAAITGFIAGVATNPLYATLITLILIGAGFLIYRYRIEPKSRRHRRK